MDEANRVTHNLSITMSESFFQPSASSAYLPPPHSSSPPLQLAESSQLPTVIAVAAATAAPLLAEVEPLDRTFTTREDALTFANVNFVSSGSSLSVEHSWKLKNGRNFLMKCLGCSDFYLRVESIIFIFDTYIAAASHALYAKGNQV